MHNQIFGQYVAARTLDILASLGILVLAWPTMLVTVLAIKGEDGWDAPAFCTQRRVGLDGRIFNALRFRTRRPDADGAERITRVGAAIRQSRIAELPLLFNVLRGEVSIILKNDRTLRWAPSVWRAVGIIVALALLGVLLVRVDAVVETAGIFRDRSQWSHPTSEDHQVECKRRQTSSSYRPQTTMVSDTIFNFQPGVTTEADVATALGAPLSIGYDPMTGQRCFTYAHTNATFRFNKSDKLIEFYGPAQTPTPSAPKQ